MDDARTGSVDQMKHKVYQYRQGILCSRSYKWDGSPSGISIFEGECTIILISMNATKTEMHMGNVNKPINRVFGPLIWSIERLPPKMLVKEVFKSRDLPYHFISRKVRGTEFVTKSPELTVGPLEG